MKIFRTILFSISSLLGLLISLIICSLLLATVLDYQPKHKEALTLKNPSQKNTLGKNTLSLMIWNIGYAGLGKDMDFFYENGKMVRPRLTQFNNYHKQITDFVKSNDSIDMILFQEVDQKAKRSYHKNQMEMLASTLEGYNYAFAPNYDVLFVPLPFSNPMGRVFSGLMSASKFAPFQSERISFAGNFSWPKKLFMLDRCFLLQRFKTAHNKDLVLINTHNSAFDAGELRATQMETLKNMALEEYSRGSYVIIGGDWNQNPPGFNPAEITNGDLAYKNDLGNISSHFLPSDWVWAYDPSLPSNRMVDKPYIQGSTHTTCIDFFLLSPNIKLKTVKTSDLQFEASDHNPMIISIELF